MKNMLGVCIVGVLLASSFAANAQKKPSTISAYAGQYKGRINFSSLAAGPANGTFKASAKKENGALKLKSNFATSGTSAALTENFSLRGRKFKYAFTAAISGGSQTGVGSGRAKVFKRTIKLTGSANIGGSTYAIDCTINRTKNGLKVQNNLIGSGGALIIYTLKKK